MSGMVPGKETTPPPAGSPRAAVVAAWEIERSRILAERYAVKRKAEEEGRDVLFAVDPPPMAPPDWWRTDAGEPTVTPLIEDPDANPEPGTIKLRYGVLGRPRTHVAGANEPTPEDQFKRATLRDRVRNLFGVQLP